MAGDAISDKSLDSISTGEMLAFPNQPVTMPIKMPSPRSKTAPRFDGKKLREFLNEYEIHAKAAMLTEDEKSKLLMSYLSTKVKRTVEDLPKFKKGT